MKSVLISIRPEWCEKIASGKKTLEIRKTRPKSDTPFKCYIYCTKNGCYMEQSKTNRAKWTNRINKYGGKVIGEFVCDKITSFGFYPDYSTLTHRHGGYDVSFKEFSEIELYKNSCLDFEEMFEYIEDSYGYAWHISDLVIYDKPKELCNFEGITTIGYFDKNGKLHSVGMTRPPQSWCYVWESEVIEND